MFTVREHLSPQKFRTVFLTSLLLAMMELAIANSLPRSDPTNLGFDQEYLDMLRSDLNRLVTEQSAPGSSVLVARDGKVVFEHVAGVLDVETGAPVKSDSLFRIYSMTKTVTAFAALQLVDEGIIGLDDPIHPHVPEWENLKALEGDKEVTAKPITLRHLITHTSGLSYGYYGDTKVDRMYREAGIIGDWDYLTYDTKEMVEKLATIPLLFQPGSRWHYGLSSDVLGHVIERISGLSLDQYMEERIFNPLGVSDAYFDVPDDVIDRFGTNQYRKADGGYRIQDTPREDPEFIGVTFLSGGGGLVMTTEGFAKFAVMLERRGELAGKRLMSNATANLMHNNQMPEQATAAGSAPRSLGLYIRNRSENEEQLYWLYGAGAAGTYFAIGGDLNLVIVVMVQVLNSTSREAQAVHRRVLQSLGIADEN